MNITHSFSRFKSVYNVYDRNKQSLTATKYQIQNLILEEISKKLHLRPLGKKYSMCYDHTMSDRIITDICDEKHIDYMNVVKHYTKSPDPIPLWDNFLKFFNKLPNYKITIEDKIIMNCVAKMIIPEKVKMYTYEDALAHLDSSTSAGYDHNMSKGKLLEQEGLFNFLNRVDAELKSGNIIKHPCKFATRGKVSSIEAPKSRLIWIYPFEMCVVEGMIAFPIYDFVGTVEPSLRTMLIGKGSFEELIRICSQCPSGCKRITTDWSGFDQHVPKQLLYLALDAIFSRVEKKFLNNQYNGSKYWKMIKSRTKDYFVHTPFVLPNGYTGRKYQGVPSGSPFTQIVDSFINLFMVWRALAGSFMSPHVLGDDLTFVIPCEVVSQAHRTVNKIKQYCKEKFGAILNKSKTVISSSGEPAEFLGYVCDNGLNIADSEKLFRSLILSSTQMDIGTTYFKILCLMKLGAHDDARFQVIYEELLKYRFLLPQKNVEMKYWRNKVKYVLGLDIDQVIAMAQEHVHFAVQPVPPYL